MTISVDQLKGHELELAFHHATGYTGFDYYPDRNCWRAELTVGHLGIKIVSVICETGVWHNSAYRKDFSDSKILEELKAENIGLKWDEDSNVVLYYQALPEITATRKTLKEAYMSVVIKKEIGESISSDVIYTTNMLKTSSKPGPPL